MRTYILIAAIALGACARVESVNVDEDEVLNSLETPIEAAGTGSAAPGSTEASEWFTRVDDTGPWAGYGAPLSEARFAVRCQAGQLIFNTTEMPTTGPGNTTMSLSGPRIDENLSAEAVEEGLPHTEATVPANAPWLERLVAASGELTVQVGGSSRLVVPISDPLTRLVGECMRSSNQAPAPATEAPAPANTTAPAEDS